MCWPLRFAAGGQYPAFFFVISAINYDRSIAHWEYFQNRCLLHLLLITFEALVFSPLIFLIPASNNNITGGYKVVQEASRKRRHLHVVNWISVTNNLPLSAYRSFLSMAACARRPGALLCHVSRCRLCLCLSQNERWCTNVMYACLRVLIGSCPSPSTEYIDPTLPLNLTPYYL